MLTFESIGDQHRRDGEQSKGCEVVYLHRIVSGIPTFAYYVMSVFLHVRADRSLAALANYMVRVLVLAGSACLLVVVLTHVAERWHILPGMGWGLSNGPGHYLDLFSAIAGIALLLAAYVSSRR
jgi:hypothetical protein